MYDYCTVQCGCGMTGGRVLDTFMVKVVGPILRVYLHPKVEGRHLVPAQGRLLIAANHLSFIDSFLIPMAVLPRRVTTLTKAEYFEGTGLKGAFVRWFLTSMGYVPVRRGTGRAALGALDQAVEIVESGRAFLYRMVAVAVEEFNRRFRGVE